MELMLYFLRGEDFGRYYLIIIMRWKCVIMMLLVVVENVSMFILIFFLFDI